MELDQLKKELGAHGKLHDDEDVARWESKYEKKIPLLLSTNILAIQYQLDGLRVNVVLGFSEADRQAILESLNTDFWHKYYPHLNMAILYYPLANDSWDGEYPHMQYLFSDNDIGDEFHERQAAMKDIMHDIFFLNGSFQHDIKRDKGDRSLTDILRGRINVDSPALWPYLPQVFDWWNKSRLPKWGGIDLLEQTVNELEGQYSGRAGYVYLIEGAEGWFKIGRSKTPEKRIVKLEVVLPFEIEAKHIIPTDDMYQAEARLHEIFDYRRGRGEWFALTGDEVNAICGLDEIRFMPTK